MASLVTCEGIGSALQGWLENASAEDLAKFCELLKCPINIGGAGSGLMGSGTPDDPLRLDLSEDKGNTIELRENGLFSKPKISGQKGNLIQERDDGIYYGQEAAPDVRNLFVDSQVGDDGNTGKKDAPLRSIREALTRQVPQTRFTIWLHEDMVHEWRSSWGQWDNYGVEMRPYGESTTLVTNKIFKGSGVSPPFSTNQFKYPTLKFVCDATVPFAPNRNIDFPHVVITTGPLRWNFWGLHLDLTAPVFNDLSTFRIGFLGDHGGALNVEFSGCRITEGENFFLATIGRVSTLRFDGIQYAQNGIGTVKIINSELSLEFGDTANGFTEGTPAKPEGSGLTYHETIPVSGFGQHIVGVKGISTSNLSTVKDIGSTN